MHRARLNFKAMVAVCCIEDASSTWDTVAQLAGSEFVKSEAEIGATPGSAITPGGPMLPSGRTPGTAKPAETKDSAG